MAKGSFVAVTDKMQRTYRVNLARPVGARSGLRAGAEMLAPGAFGGKT